MCRSHPCLPLLLGVLSLAVAPACGATGPGASDWRCDVHVELATPSADGPPDIALSVHLRLPRSARHLALAPELAPHVGALAWFDGASWRELPGAGPSWRLPRGARRTPELRYRVRITEAARALDDPDLAQLREGALLAPPSGWVLCPIEGERRPLDLRFSLPRGWSASAALPEREPVPARPPPRGVGGDGARVARYDVAPAALDQTPLLVLGALLVREVRVGASRLAVVFAPQAGEVLARIGTAWIEDAGRAVAGYLGGFPVARHTILVWTDGSGHPDGTTYPRAAGWTELEIDARTGADTLRDDWVATHELVHVGFPTLAPKHRWLEEGLATYVEPIARARAGLIPRERLWRELARGLPRGVPGASDAGLDGTRAWGRTYWGGALFCFLADLEIRRRTRGERGLEHALRAIVAAGGVTTERWPIERVLAVGDGGTGVPVLAEQYARWRNDAVHVDLGDLWERLGVRIERRRVAFDDTAPEAWLRRAITTGARARPSSPGWSPSAGRRR